MSGLTLVVEYSLLVAAEAASLFWPNFSLIFLTVGCSDCIFSEDCSWMNCSGTRSVFTERVKVTIDSPKDCSTPKPFRGVGSTGSTGGAGGGTYRSLGRSIKKRTTCKQLQQTVEKGVCVLKIRD